MLDPGRGVGVTESLAAGSEWPLVLVVALLTQLGDVWLLGLVGGVAYLAGERLPGLDRRRGLFVLALVLTYVALVGVLKAAFGLPRPPGASTAPALPGYAAALEPVLADAATGEGNGFPSGHALGTTMVWGGLALVLEWGRRRARLAVAGGLVVLVSATRLALGVHYLVDVLAGVGVGALALVLSYRLAERGATAGRVLLVAAVVGAVGVAIHAEFETVAAFGVAVGSALGWYGVAGRTGTPDGDAGRGWLTRPVLFAGVGGFAVVVALFGGLYAVGPAHPLTFALASLTGAIAVAAPALGAWASVAGN